MKTWDDATGLPERFLKAHRLIGLLVEGKTFSSQELAQWLQELMNQGKSHIVLVIGGAEGMPPRAAKQVQERWSLSRLTFSHQLTRLILREGF